ncbi:MAG TPA: S49 family peptidase [Candidatus Babeliales bacterium]|nr:S49 family peptidase [Candidatus Babeliales bacterium]
MTLFESVKTILILILFVYAAPFLIENIKKQYMPLLEPHTYIGVLQITRPLHNSFCITEGLHCFFKDPYIKGIVIKIDCSNTASGSSQTIFHDIRQLKREYPKPIIALVENICTSGAYLVASACDYIIAPESAIIGDIGQTFCAWQLQKLNEEKNNNFEGIANESYQQLTKQIALSRKLSLTTTANWADGKFFTGTQALALGLINEIGSMCTVIKIIKEKALIEGEIEWIEQSKNKPHATSSLEMSVQ